MGLLNTDGAPMVWGSNENNSALKYVRDHGIEQLILLYNRYSGMEESPFLWGDEIEHIIVKEDPVTKELKLSLNAAPILDKLNNETVSKSNTTTAWRPEYGSFMIESVPAAPFTSDLASYLKVEGNMADRCRFISEACGKGERSVMMVSFPLMGVGNFHTRPEETGNQYSESLFVQDICINQTHPRFGNLTRNIRLRRGRKVCIQVPMYIDTNTLEKTVDKTYNIDAHPQNLAIDCCAIRKDNMPKAGQKRIGFDTTSSDESSIGEDVEEDEEIARRKAKGIRNCEAKKSVCGSIGITGSVSKNERRFFKHLFTPSTDYYYAQYTRNSENVKARYDSCPCPVPSVINPCVYMDCMAFGMGLSCLQVTMQLKNITEARHIYDQVVPLCAPMLALTAATPFQKGILCDSDVRWITISASVDDRQRTEVPRIIKSRYDSVSMYIGKTPEDMQQFNDNHVEIDQAYFEKLKDAGIDDRLAKHFAHLFIRDPLVIFENGVHELDDNVRSDHFENIQSTNWQTVRFKPPPYNSDIGWRVEFRVMEVMPTPFENAAFSVFTILFVKAVQKYGAITYIPMSLNDTNTGRAHMRKPSKEKYFWRSDMFSSTDLNSVEMTLDEIYNGVEGSSEGLIPMVRRYLRDERMEDPKIEKYLQFISRRATGELKTTADLLREFVVTHPDYQKDSRLTQSIAKDVTSFVGHLEKTLSWPGYLPEELTGGKHKEFQYGQVWA